VHCCRARNRGVTDALIGTLIVKVKNGALENQP